jgi:hypothetical protein
MMDLEDGKEGDLERDLQRVWNGLELNAALFAALAFLEFLASWRNCASLLCMHTVFFGTANTFCFSFDDCTIVFTEKKGDIPDVLYASIISPERSDICENAHPCVYWPNFERQRFCVFCMALSFSRAVRIPRLLFLILSAPLYLSFKEPLSLAAHRASP